MKHGAVSDTRKIIITSEKHVLPLLKIKCRTKAHRTQSFVHRGVLSEKRGYNFTYSSVYICAVRHIEKLSTTFSGYFPAKKQNASLRSLLIF